MQSKQTLIVISAVAACVLLAALTGLSLVKLKKNEREFNLKKVVLVKENLDFKYRIEAIQDALNQKTESLDILEKEKKLLEENIISLKRENEEAIKSYKGGIDVLKKKNSILRKKISALENSPIIQRIKEASGTEENENIKKVLEDAAAKIEIIKEGKLVNLDSIVVKSGGTEGVVLSVESKHRIVVINLGKKDGIREGCRVTIFKGKTYIASGNIVSVRYRISASVVDDIQAKYNISDIEESDRVVVSQLPRALPGKNDF